MPYASLVYILPLPNFRWLQDAKKPGTALRALQKQFFKLDVEHGILLKKAAYTIDAGDAVISAYATI